jgi:hypothetical protein
MAITYGFAMSEWVTARGWTGQPLHQIARARATTTYSDLTTEMAKAGLSRLDPCGAPNDCRSGLSYSSATILER